MLRNEASSSNSLSLVQKINKIGSDYLTKYPSHFYNLIHTNQPIAEKLKNYTPDKKATNKDHEVFLVCCYLQLPNFNGQVAAAIRNFFYYELEEKELNDQYLILHTPLEALQMLGEEYLKKWPQPSPWYSLYRHNNQAQAHAIQKCQVVDNITHQIILKPTTTQVWKMFLSCYESLSDPCGKLAGSISNIIEKVFGFKIATVKAAGEQVRKLTTAEIKASIEPDMMKRIKTEEGSRILQPIPRSATTFNF